MTIRERKKALSSVETTERYLKNRWDKLETEEDIMFELATFNKEKDDYGRLEQTVRGWNEIPILGVTTEISDLDKCVDPSYLGHVYKPLRPLKSIYQPNNKKTRFSDDDAL